MTYMPTFKMSSTDPAAAMLLLRSQCYEGLSNQPDNPTKKSHYRARLDAELDIIKTKNFSNYFLIVADYVRWARTNQIAVGPGRGSGPCSLVAYLLEITRIDPIKHLLPFERFVNPDRQTLPDFDIDFCADRCDEIVQYLQARYGNERLAQISSSDNTPLSSRLVIGDRSLEELVPLSVHQGENIFTTSLTIKEVADAGLVRFNVIGNKTLSLIHRVLREIRLTDREIDLERIPLDDERTYRTLMAVNGIETNCYNNLPGGEHYEAALKLVKPDSFDALCATIALSFPALQARTFSFTQQANDSMLVSIPVYQAITKETRGHLLYQEQLMDIALQVAGFTYAQGDSFRRVLKQPKHPDQPTFRDNFSAGVVANGYSQTEAEALYQHIAKFGGAYFNKSHAIAYGMLVYQLMWLQTYFPVEWSAVTSNQK